MKHYSAKLSACYTLQIHNLQGTVTQVVCACYMYIVYIHLYALDLE